MDLTGLLDYERTHHTVRETNDHHKAHEETRKLFFFFIIIFNYLIQIFTLNLRIKKEGFHHRNKRVNLRRSSADAVMDLRHARTATRWLILSITRAN